MPLGFGAVELFAICLAARPAQPSWRVSVMAGIVLPLAVVLLPMGMNRSFLFFHVATAS
jgi:hypothetical protein